MSYNLLKGKKGLIFGALNDKSIAWQVAERAAMAELAEKLNTIFVPADATSVEDLERLIDKTMEHFGGKFDFILHSIGMSPNVRSSIRWDFPTVRPWRPNPSSTLKLRPRPRKSVRRGGLPY